MQDNREVNLFNVQPKKREYNLSITEEEREILSKYGREYFNTPFERGYKKYEYNGAFRSVAKNVVNFFKLKDGSRILDVGCAKGFLLHDLKEINPTFEVYGVDISSYAVSEGMPSVKDNLVCSSAADIPFEDKYFDLVTCNDVLVNLTEEDARKAVREINRLSRKHKFIQTPAYRTEVEKNNLLNWVAIHMCVLHVDEWKELYRQEGYDGYYYWWICHDL